MHFATWLLTLLDVIGIITLKEMHGKNRINDFIQMCQLNGWIVNRVDIDNRIDIYNVAEEDVEFE